jgi:hypothetical protein
MFVKGPESLAIIFPYIVLIKHGHLIYRTTQQATVKLNIKLL